MYELYIEGFKVDIDQKISIALTYAIDDVANFSSRETGFSKTIVLPGTGRNNQIFGFIYDLGSFNYELPGAANIGSVFNVAQTSRAELRLNGLLVLRGVFRITNIIKDKDIIEYEGAIFGELSGFIAEIGGGKLENLDFSEYDHQYTRDNIVNSWNTINGSGYYYPLIDHGTYSANKISYNYKTFRPALFLREYIDKIFEFAGYTFESSFFDSNFFKKIIIPCNVAKITKRTNDILSAARTVRQDLAGAGNTDVSGSYVIALVSYPTIYFANGISDDGDPNFTYTSVDAANVDIQLKINAFIHPQRANENTLRKHKMRLRFYQNDTILYEYTNEFFYTVSYLKAYTIDINKSFNINIQQNDTFRIELYYLGVSTESYINTSSITIYSTNPITADAELNDDLYLNSLIPKNILQKDFFTWIVKMFNLYIVEDKLKENHLIIEPYIDFYGTDTIDWTYKIARDKPWQIKPMGQLNGRFFEYKFKDDSDFYNEGYRKKYNESYGNRLEDTGFQFAKDKQTLEIGFAPSPLVQYSGTDKVLPAIYKKSKGNSLDQEELTESNLRILQAKKITGVSPWFIKNGSLTLSPNLGSSLTVYGYAGHFDDPINPTKDINFGAAQEIYFDPNSYTSNNLFNDYWSEYIAEIADKDSKILVCYARLTPLDIAQLDFSKAILIDGIRFRINKIEDYDYTNNELVKVELLKIINNG